MLGFAPVTALNWAILSSCSEFMMAVVMECGVGDGGASQRMVDRASRGLTRRRMWWIDVECWVAGQCLEVVSCLKKAARVLVRHSTSHAMNGLAKTWKARESELLPAGASSVAETIHSPDIH